MPVKEMTEEIEEEVKEIKPDKDLNREILSYLDTLKGHKLGLKNATFRKAAIVQGSIYRITWLTNTDVKSMFLKIEKGANGFSYQHIPD